MKYSHSHLPRKAFTTTSYLHLSVSSLDEKTKHRRRKLLNSKSMWRKMTMRCHYRSVSPFAMKSYLTSRWRYSLCLSIIFQCYILAQIFQENGNRVMLEEYDNRSHLDTKNFLESGDREQVVSYSYSDGISRQYTLHDDPTYFIGWEVRCLRLLLWHPKFETNHAVLSNRFILKAKV